MVTGADEGLAVRPKQKKSEARPAEIAEIDTSGVVFTFDFERAALSIKQGGGTAGQRKHLRERGARPCQAHHCEENQAYRPPKRRRADGGCRRAAHLEVAALLSSAMLVFKMGSPLYASTFTIISA